MALPLFVASLVLFVNGNDLPKCIFLHVSKYMAVMLLQLGRWYHATSLIGILYVFGCYALTVRSLETCHFSYRYNINLYGCYALIVRSLEPCHFYYRNNIR